jgi:Tfp pilus assembly protein FimT
LKIPVRSPGEEDGFTVIEAVIVIALMFIIASIALLDMTGISNRVAADSALYQMVAQLRRGRDLAVSQRRAIELQFQGNNQVQLVRYDLPAGRTVLSTATLEKRIVFNLFDGVPDTPDLFGKAGAVSFTGAGPLVFLSDGTLVDGRGNPVNGSVFLGLPNEPQTARSVTMLGATGRVRGYRWTGQSWIQ